ncbi:PRC-barrel domain-containing protein [Evansella sp. AB-P1]|uniref:PRC-barrel domain-containing protein n=1 Tax=Evansella sp. AB-P1 TaxID=3037653 RepID=UPI00241F568E|nr:PRC-barrel domain-containing protein [Evansella sp. AB-P1]MDG5786492.1 PRC-barrel domain-containing protein [Evansella sp. AB-P1]
MLFHLSNWLKSFSVVGNDGGFGTVDNVLFDEDKWTIRYLVVKAGLWFTNERLYISPASIEEIDIKSEMIRLNISRDQAAKAPIIGDEPISRKQEREFSSYYQFSPYWLGGKVWGGVVLARDLLDFDQPVQEVEDNEDEPKIHVANDVIGYELAAQEDTFGKIEDLLFEEESYVIRYFVVDTKKILPGKKVLISTEWISHVDWVSGRVEVTITKEQVEKSPEYLPGQPLTREIEEALFEYYDKEKYW